MNKSLEQRASFNIVLGFISFAINILSSIVLVPIFLHYWGQSNYAIWLSFFAGYTLLQSLDLGHVNYIGNKINILYHIDKLELRRNLGSSLLMAVFIGIGQFLILFLLIFLKKIQVLFGIEYQFIVDNDLIVAIIILLLQWIFAGSIGGIITRLYIPAGMLHKSQIWNIIFRLVQFVSLLIIVINRGTILYACISYAIIYVLVVLLCMRYIKKDIPELFPWWKFIDIKLALLNFKRSLILTVNYFLNQLSQNGVIIFISQFIGIIAVPAFATLRTLTNMGSTVTNLIISSILPDIARFHATEQKDKIEKLLITNWWMSGLIVNIGLIVILPVASYIYTLWTNGKLEFNLQLFLMFCIGISMLNFSSGFLNYLIIINHLKSQTIIVVARIVLLFGFSYLLFNSFKIEAIGYGILASETVCSIILPVYFVEKYLLPGFTNRHFKSLFLAIVPILILVTILIANTIFRINLVSICIITFFISIVIYFKAYKSLDNEIKFRLTSFVLKLIPIKSNK